jgi:hypothetical protein
MIITPRGDYYNCVVSPTGVLLVCQLVCRLLHNLRIYERIPHESNERHCNACFSWYYTVDNSRKILALSHSSTILLSRNEQYLKAITFGVLNVRCAISKQNENKLRSKSQVQNFLIFFYRFIAEKVRTAYSRTNYKTVPITRLNKYLHNNISETEMNKYKSQQRQWKFKKKNTASIQEEENSVL